jgi:hypothetical protein
LTFLGSRAGTEGGTGHSEPSSTTMTSASSWSGERLSTEATERSRVLSASFTWTITTEVVGSRLRRPSYAGCPLQPGGRESLISRSAGIVSDSARLKPKRGSSAGLPAGGVVTPATVCEPTRPRGTKTPDAGSQRDPVAPPEDWAAAGLPRCPAACCRDLLCLARIHSSLVLTPCAGEGASPVSGAPFCDPPSSVRSEKFTQMQIDPVTSATMPTAHLPRELTGCFRGCRSSAASSGGAAPIAPPDARWPLGEAERICCVHRRHVWSQLLRDVSQWCRSRGWLCY